MLGLEIFTGGLVRKPELRTSKNGSSYTFFTVARSYSERVNDNEWRDVGTEYINCTVFGNQAENFVKSNVPLGSQLLIVGRLQGRVNDAYTDKAGNQHPEQFEETVLVDSIAYSFERSQVITGYAKAYEVDGGTAPQQASQVKQDKPKAEQPKKAEPKKEEASDDVSDIFGLGDDWLSGDASDGIDSLLEGL